MLGKTSPAMFRAPLWEINIKKPCDPSLLQQLLWRLISKQDKQAVQVFASHWQWYSWSKCRLFIFFGIESWHTSFLMEKGPKLPFSLESKHTVFGQYDKYLRRVTFHCWISHVPKICCVAFPASGIYSAKVIDNPSHIDRSQHLGLIFSACLVMFGCHNLKCSQPLEAFWPRLWPPQRKRLLVGESL